MQSRYFFPPNYADISGGSSTPSCSPFFVPFGRRPITTTASSFFYEAPPPFISRATTITSPFLSSANLMQREFNRSYGRAINTLAHRHNYYPIGGYYSTPLPSAEELLTRVYRPVNRCSAVLLALRRSRSDIEISASANTLNCCPIIKNNILQERRSNKFDILRAVWVDSAATTVQRHWRGFLGRRRAEAEAIAVREYAARVAAATRIQRAFRKWRGHMTLVLEAVSLLLSRKRAEAATKIQRVWRKLRAAIHADIAVLAETLYRARTAAACVIQRCYRGYVERVRLDVECRRWVLEWRYDSPGHVVEVVGTFSRPQWTRRVLLPWSPTKRCYTVALPRIPGRHEFKFVVDGVYCCDGAYTVVSDGAGHYNNVSIISEAPERSPFQQIRRRLYEIELRRRRNKISVNRTCPAIAGGSSSSSTSDDDCEETPQQTAASSEFYQAYYEEQQRALEDQPTTASAPRVSPSKPASSNKSSRSSRSSRISRQHSPNFIEPPPYNKSIKGNFYEDGEETTAAPAAPSKRRRRRCRRRADTATRQATTSRSSSELPVNKPKKKHYSRRRPSKKKKNNTRPDDYVSPAGCQCPGV